MKKLYLASRASRLSYSGIVVTDFEVRSIALTNLHCPVRSVPSFASGVRESIEREGLHSPVIVVRMPREDLLAFYAERNVDQQTVPAEPWLNVVCGGTNRVEAALALGYEAIDCVLLPDLELALRVQSRQRHKYAASSQE